MAEKTFRVEADVHSDQPDQIRAVLERWAVPGHVAAIPGGYHVTAELSGESAKDLNRALLSDLRRVVKKTRIRSRWSGPAGEVRFFDYVQKR